MTLPIYTPVYRNVSTSTAPASASSRSLSSTRADCLPASQGPFDPPCLLLIIPTQTFTHVVSIRQPGQGYHIALSYPVLRHFYLAIWAGDAALLDRPVGGCGGCSAKDGFEELALGGEKGGDIDEVIPVMLQTCSWVRWVADRKGEQGRDAFTDLVERAGIERSGILIQRHSPLIDVDAEHAHLHRELCPRICRDTDPFHVISPLQLDPRSASPPSLRPKH